MLCGGCSKIFLKVYIDYYFASDIIYMYVAAEKMRRYYMRRESEWREVSFFQKGKAYFTALFFNDERGVIKVGL